LKRKLIIGFVCLAIATLLAGGLGVWWIGADALFGNAPLFRGSAIKCTLEWGRLAPIPQTAGNVKITTEGSSFSRSFRLFFKAPDPDIEKWLHDSPGSSECQPSFPSPGIRHFEMKPGGGATQAELTVDDNQHTVAIYVAWS
jgi:hypothetical protein